MNKKNIVNAINAEITAKENARVAFLRGKMEKFNVAGCDGEYVGEQEGKRRYFNDGWSHRNKKSKKWTKGVTAMVFADNRKLQSALDKGKQNWYVGIERAEKEAGRNAR